MEHTVETLKIKKIKQEFKMEKRVYTTTQGNILRLTCPKIETIYAAMYRDGCIQLAKYATQG